MTRLDQSVRKARKVLEKEAEKMLKAAIKNGSLHVWKNRKIISVKEWEEKTQKTSNQHELLEYIPADHIEYPLFYNPKDKKEEEEMTKWSNDWIEFLEHKKNSAYGKHKCKQCILHPSPNIISTNIRDILLKYLDENTTFPCSVVNMFECPYEQGKKDNSLLWLGFVCRTVDDAISIVPDRMIYGEINEIYNILTDRKKLDLILDKYIEYVASGQAIFGESKSVAEEKADQIRKIKKPIVDLFAAIKDKIRVAEFTRFDK